MPNLVCMPGIRRNPLLEIWKRVRAKVTKTRVLAGGAIIAHLVLEVVCLRKRLAGVLDR